MKKLRKSFVQYAYICDQCGEGNRLHFNRAWTTKAKRDKGMLNHTKKTGHILFYRSISEDL